MSNEHTLVSKSIVEVELNKFLSIAVTTTNPLKMWSQRVDQAWHQLIEDKVRYDAHCHKEFGCVIGHIPRSGYSKIDWIEEYEKRYGELDTVWFQDRNGKLYGQLLEEYLWTGEIYASWDCTPKIEPMVSTKIPKTDKKPNEVQPTRDQPSANKEEK